MLIYITATANIDAQGKGTSGSNQETNERKVNFQNKTGNTERT